MSRRNFVIFLFLDFASLVAVFLIFTYYGMCHVLLLFLGLLFLILGIYDLKTGILSLLIMQLFNMPVKKGKSGKLNIIPVIMAVVVVLYSFPRVLEHGLINKSQEYLMQGNYFTTFTLWLVGAGLFVLIAAIGTHFGGRKNDD